jgi:hypothetical protein
VRHEPELGGEHHLITTTLQSTANELLIRVGAIDLGRVDEGDSELQRAVNGSDGLGVIATRARVGSGHAHGAKADAADIESAEFDVFHGDLLSGLATGSSD